MRRPADRGKGLDGVAAHAEDYFNPVVDLLEKP
jgi:beta-lysine 5,6-aminomutase alpha subunit